MKTAFHLLLSKEWALHLPKAGAAAHQQQKLSSWLRSCTYHSCSHPPTHFFFFFLKQTSKTCVWGSISKQAQSSWQSAFLGAIRSNCLFIGINLGLRNLNQDDGLILLYKHIQESKLYCKHSYLTQVKRSPDNLSWRVERGRQSDKPKVTLSLWKMGYKHCLDMLVRPVCASADKFGG